ncbi:hypothetical protein RXV94_00495 [Yeosuana sp. MJ-SS3]|uniref:Lipoprotein n=1 Tax=Gilvirhabdus luticola TaxID=3079858 RepID=A0ABU3U2J1_9FLAO|nr:hypothetical protein [Yeosuana sp. MJ-SS3]MDU8884617.1 hypothetical protein [Yeosuana sp. MJ-SS3]
MKQIVNIFFGSFILLSFSHCSSAQNLQDNAPVELGEVYYQKWVAGIQGGGSGINLFVNLVENNQNVIFDSVYFRGKSVKLGTNSSNNSFVGRFSTVLNRKPDVILSDKPQGEFGNQVPIIPKSIPFNLKDNECVISYKENNRIKYFKIKKIKEKPTLSYPSTPQNKQ